MSKPAISIQNLGKNYLLRHKQNKKHQGYQRLSEELVAWVKRLSSRLSGGDAIRRSKTKEEFWALRNLDLEIAEGQVVGIIGRNGAGKSTLLKILSRITSPSEGSFRIRGRVASLLEVGTGFHPELTGRENIYLNGTLLGMRRAEIRARFDEITDFAGVEKSLDTPVKRFSSGMQSRLAFAVAAHLEPEILIVDEVLAVGDYEFQKRCLGKMRDVSRSGRTVLFVSHNLSTIASLTSQCILLKDGRLVESGPTSETIHSYIATSEVTQSTFSTEPRPSLPTITKIEVKTSHQGAIQKVMDTLEFHLTVQCPTPLKGACISIQLCDRAAGQPSALLYLFDSESPILRTKGIHQLVCHIPKCHLYIGDYDLSVNLTAPPGGPKFQRLENICPFTVDPFDYSRKDFPLRSGEASYFEDFQWRSKAVSS